MNGNPQGADEMNAAGSHGERRPEARCLPLLPLSFCAGIFFSGRTIFVLVTARWLNIGTEAGVLAGFALAAGLALGAALGAFGAQDNARTRGSSRPLQWAILYLAFSGCSLFWTASVSVSSSALYWFSLAGDVALAILLSRGGAGPEPAAHSLLKGYIAGSCALAAVAWLMPAAADLRLGDIDYFNTNQIANLCAFSLLMCSFLAARGDAVWRIVPWFLGVTLLRSLSKATLAAFVACLLYRLFCDASIPRRKKWLLATSTAVLTLSFWGLIGAYYTVYTTAGNQAETLTGRTAIWAWTLDASLKKPWFGNGFDGMWKVAPPFGAGLYEARHAENELLQQFFAYGACGVVLLVGVYGSLWSRIRKLPFGPERAALTAFLIYVAVRGLAEAEPFDLLLPLWLVTTFALVLAQPSQTQPAVHTDLPAAAGLDILPAR